MLINTVFGEQKIQTKKCVYCKEDKPLNEFGVHKHHFDGYDQRCIKCVRERAKIVNNLRKTAPPKPKVCECCGKEPNSGPTADNTMRKLGLALDHDPVENTFRGWLCDSCNRAIGALGDNIEGVTNALNYLKRKKHG